jgi:hypothetical protein
MARDSVMARLREFLPTVYERYGPLVARQYAYRAETEGIIDTSRGKKKPFDHVNRVLVELREGGILPYSAVLDASREFDPPPFQGDGNPDHHLRRAARAFFSLCRAEVPRWHTQPRLPVIVTEKEGMLAYFEMVTRGYEVPVYAIRGQAGKSHLHEVFVPWLRGVMEAGKEPVLIYLGDCDDYGIQIQRTLEKTLERWGLPPKPGRLALTPEQVEELGLSKLEVRSKPHTLHGKYLDFKCEIEAMDPELLRTLIRRTIESLTDRRAEERRVRLERRLNRELERLAGRLTRNWPADLRGRGEPGG